MQPLSLLSHRRPVALNKRAFPRAPSLTPSFHGWLRLERLVLLLRPFLFFPGLRPSGRSLLRWRRSMRFASGTFDDLHQVEYLAMSGVTTPTGPLRPGWEIDQRSSDYRETQLYLQKKAPRSVPNAIFDVLMTPSAGLILIKWFVRRNRGWIPAQEACQVSDREPVRAPGKCGIRTIFSW